MKGTILTSYTKDFSEGDETGEASLVAMTFHQLVTAAILQMAYYPINALRVGKLKSTFARWLTTRMSHNYRQARKNDGSIEIVTISLLTLFWPNEGW